MLSVFITLFISILWALLFYLFIRKITIIRNGFFLGILVIILVTLFILSDERIFQTYYYGNLIPIVEELFKFLVIYFYSFAGDYSDKEFYIFGASIGLGFAFIENIITFETMIIMFIVNIFGSLFHIITSMISSFIVIKSRKYDDKGWLIAFIAPVLIHYFYNMVIVDFLMILFNLN